MTERADDAEGRRHEEAPRKRTKPTPVRAMAAAEAPPSPTEPDVEEAEIEVDEVDWVVRVLGRSGGARDSATPLLLLGFWRADRADRAREREALVVGTALAKLTPAALRGAFRESTPPREPPSRDSTGPGRGRRRGSGRGARGRGR